MIKIIKTEVNQKVEIDIPQGYIYDASVKLDINTFTGKLLVPIKRVGVSLDGEDDENNT